MHTVQTFLDPWEAHLLRMRLSAEGIPAFVANELHVWNNWPVSNALGGVRVQVPDDYEPLAVEVWRRYRAGEYESELAKMFGAFDDTLHCPRCGSSDIKRRPTAAELAFGLTVGLFFACVKFGHSRCMCRACAKRWTNDG